MLLLDKKAWIYYRNFRFFSSKKGGVLSEKTFTFTIVTPEKIVYYGDVVSLVLPAEKGYLGILANHAPLFCEIKVGIVKLTLPSQPLRLFAVTSGFLEVRKNHVTLYCEASEPKEEIDGLRAKTAYGRALERMKSKQGLDVLRAEYALSRAANRLRLFETRTPDV